MTQRSLTLAALIPFLLGTGFRLIPQVDPAPLPITDREEPPTALSMDNSVEDHGTASPLVAGQVLDAEGRPVAGAEVRFTLDRESRLFETLLPEEQKQVHSVRSDALGAFRIDTLTPGAPYDVVAVRPGYAPTLTAFSSRETGLTPELRLVLRRGKTLRGIALDDQGRPVEGAEVWLQRSTHTGVFTDVPLKKAWPDSNLYHAVTSPDGRFEVADLPDQALDLGIWSSNFAPHFRNGILLPADQEVISLGSFRLQPGATLEGRVTDSHGTPLPEAVVGGADAAAQSGRDGRFVLRGLAPGAKLYLSVCRPGYQTVSDWLEASASEAARIALEPAGRIAGWVLTPDGSPVAGAEVRASGDGSGRSWTFPKEPCLPSDFARDTTDAQGRFDLEGLSPGPFTLWVMAEGHPKEILTAEARATASPLTVELQPGAVLAGRVLGADGRPVSGAMILDDEYLYGHPRTLSGPDGTYRLAGVRAGARSITILHPGHQEMSKTLRIEPGDNHFDAQLNPIPRVPVRGRVLGPDGLPVVGARVKSNGKIAAATASDGSFVLLVEDGSYTLESQAGSHAPAFRDVTVAGKAVNGVDLRLARGITVTGRIAGIAPEELAGASVSALSTRDDEMYWEATVDSAGRYRLQGLFPDLWTLAVHAGERKQYESLVLAASDGTRELDVVLPASSPEEQKPAEELPQGISLRGRLNGVTLEDPADVSLWAHKGESDWRHATVARNGEYRLSGLSPGIWEVEAHFGIDRAAGRVRLEPGMDEAELDLTFVPGDLTLSGHIAGAADLPSLHVHLEGEGLGYGVWATADEKGELPFARLHPGKYSLTLYCGGDLRQVTEIEIAKDQEVVLDLKGARGR